MAACSITRVTMVVVRLWASMSIAGTLRAIAADPPVAETALRGAAGSPALTLETVTPPRDISPDEPVAKEFSLPQAARAMDVAALHWQKSRSCTACHTMLPYLMA